MLPSLRKVISRLKPRGRASLAPDDDEPPRREGRARSAWRRFRRATDRYRLLTDVIGAVLLVAIVVGSIAAATGGVWPPIVVVESGSMMHPDPETPYGRLGSIDVGDIVFIKAVNGPEDVTTWADGGKDRYGRPGDVIAYAPRGNFSETPVIHRAIAYIEVTRRDDGERVFALHWTDGEVIPFGPQGIYFPPLGLDEEWGFTRTNGYRPAYSGYVTKGDNAYSNPALDQVMPTRDAPITTIIEPAWIIGEVYGEVPWMGLGKLTFQSRTNPEVTGWERIGNAFAPLELWTMFFLTLAILIFIPLSIDTYRAWREMRRKQETERRIEEELRARNAARKAELAKLASAKRVTTFAAVVSRRPQSPRDPLPGRAGPAREGGK